MSEVVVNRLEYENVVGAGVQVRATMNQEVPCLAFPGDLSGKHVIMQKCDAPLLVSTEPWIQFAPDEWDAMIVKLFNEMVDAWNEKFGGGE